MEGQLIVPVPQSDEDQKFFHLHGDGEIELEPGTATTIDWRGSEHVQTIYRCPACSQQVARLEPMIR
jgi:hypothetical protein